MEFSFLTNEECLRKSAEDVGGASQARATPQGRPLVSTGYSGASSVTAIQQNHAQGAKFQAPPPQNVITVSRRQEGNPVLKYITNVRWRYGDIVPDYLLGRDTCALFLSLRYHLLHPDYLFYRIKQLQRAFRVRVILCHVDVEDVTKPLEEVMKTGVFHDCTVICAWTHKECARYLETYKSYETKPPDLIQEHVDNDYKSKLAAVLSCIRGINKTDATTLGTTFGSFSNILGASKERLSACPGVGPTKLQRLHDTFQQPFRMTSSKPQNSQGVGPSSAVESHEASHIACSSRVPHPAGASGRHETLIGSRSEDHTRDGNKTVGENVVPGHHEVVAKAAGVDDPGDYNSYEGVGLATVEVIGESDDDSEFGWEVEEF